MKNVFLKISQNSQKNTCGVSGLQLYLKKRLQHSGFLCEFCKIFKSKFSVEHL